jgi:hypothetical protein
MRAHRGRRKIEAGAMTAAVTDNRVDNLATEVSSSAREDACA